MAAELKRPSPPKPYVSDTTGYIPAQTTFILSLHVQRMHVSKFVNSNQTCNMQSNLCTLPLPFEFQPIDMVSWDGAIILP